MLLAPESIGERDRRQARRERPHVGERLHGLEETADRARKLVARRTRDDLAVRFRVLEHELVRETVVLVDQDEDFGASGVDRCTDNVFHRFESRIRVVERVPVHPVALAEPLYRAPKIRVELIHDSDVVSAVPHINAEVEFHDMVLVPVAKLVLTFVDLGAVEQCVNSPC